MNAHLEMRFKYLVNSKLWRNSNKLNYIKMASRSYLSQWLQE